MSLSPGARLGPYEVIAPVHAIAVAHTHPAADLYPSANDVADARRIHMAVIVITVDALTMARSDGTVATLERGSRWRAGRQ